MKLNEECGAQEVLVGPVVAADGACYERAAMRAWLSQHGAVSPTTGLALEHTDLVPNLALRSYIDWRA